VVLKECEAEEALAQEIKIQHFCSHPNILKLYGYIDEDDKIILILEYATHGDLYKELKNQVNILNNISHKNLSFK
jgi:serine/threonine protein kinase